MLSFASVYIVHRSRRRRHRRPLSVRPVVLPVVVVRPLSVRPVMSVPLSSLVCRRPSSVHPSVPFSIRPVNVKKTFCFCDVAFASF